MAPRDYREVKKRRAHRPMAERWGICTEETERRTCGTEFLISRSASLHELGVQKC
jgi:hypothetical protein